MDVLVIRAGGALLGALGRSPEEAERVLDALRSDAYAGLHDLPAGGERQSHRPPAQRRLPP